MKKRVAWIDILKGFAIFLVVFNHSVQRTMAGLENSDEILAEIEFFIKSFYMPLFFFCSGCVYALRPKANPRKIDLVYIKNKAVDLLIPYVFFAVLVWVGKMVFSNYVTVNVSFSDLLEMFINPIAFLWFIYILFFVSVLVYILDCNFEKRWQVTLILLVMTLSRCFITTGIKLIDRVLFYPIFYYMGVLFFENRNKIKKATPAIIGLIFAVVYVLYYRYSQIMLLTIIVNSLGVLFFSTIFYLIFRNVEKPCVLSYLGCNTLYIYIIHPVVLDAFRVLLLSIGTMKSELFWVCSLSVVGLICSIIYIELSKKIWVLDLPFKPRKTISNLKK